MLASVVITTMKLYHVMECELHSCTEAHRGGLEAKDGLRQQLYHKAP